MQAAARSYTALCQSFRWDIPEYYNIGADICDKWARCAPERLAIVDVSPDGTSRNFNFAELKSRSNQLANALSAAGLGRSRGVGDRIAVLLPQSIETAVSHIAILKMGCIALPLSTLFGEEALLHRQADSGARAVITNAEGARKLALLRDTLPDLGLIVLVDGPGGDPDAGRGEGVHSFQALCDAQSGSFSPLQTLAEDPAILIYTSGTTGNPKGALHAHRVLLGHLPGVEMSHDFFPQPGDRIWTPADWAWIGGLLDVLMPALHHGVTVVSCRMAKFDAGAAFDLIRRYKIRNVFLPPTALKIMRQNSGSTPPGLGLRSVASGGEPLGAELLSWGRKVFGTTINEFYGQTECNVIVSCCAAIEAPSPGVMGRPVPGHDVAVIGSDGDVMATGQEGNIAVRAPDPVMFLEYWNNPKATSEKFADGPGGRWMLTGDRGIVDADGQIRFVGRDDDVITSAGYRIGPAEIENCLLGHPAVMQAGVVARPDPLRGTVVQAYIVLNTGFEPSDDLGSDVAAYVKSKLAAYEYPRVVRFIGDMPMTTTGKVVRAELRRWAEAEVAAESAQIGGP